LRWRRPGRRVECGKTIFGVFEIAGALAVEALSRVALLPGDLSLGLLEGRTCGRRFFWPRSRGRRPPSRLAEAAEYAVVAERASPDVAAGAGDPGRWFAVVGAPVRGAVVLPRGPSCVVFMFRSKWQASAVGFGGRLRLVPSLGRRPSAATAAHATKPAGTRDCPGEGFLSEKTLT